MQTKGVHLWLWGILALASLSAGCLEAVVGDAGECSYEGKRYAAGERFAASDGCNSCVCSNDGSVACTEKACSGDDTGSSSGAPMNGATNIGEGCKYDGKVFKIGATFLDSAGCKTCSCELDGSILCDDNECPVTCTYAGNSYAVGASFPSGDGCNSCTCEPGGKIPCTNRVCAPVCQQDGKTYQAGAVVPGGPMGLSCTCGMNGQIACVGQGCDYGGKSYASGATFPSSDGCNSCSCNMGGVSCSEKACSGTTCTLNGKTYKQGETFYDDLRCNSCSCTATGGVACTARACDPQTACTLGAAMFASGNHVLCEDGCNDCLCANGTWTSSDKTCPALRKIEPCEAGEQMNAKANVLYQAGDSLALEVSFLGCDRAAYKLCWGSFQESDPVQTQIKVVPTGASSCMTWATQQAVFDVTPLREAYLAAHQTKQGKISMQIYGAGHLYAF